MSPTELQKTFTTTVEQGRHGASGADIGKLAHGPPSASLTLVQMPAHEEGAAQHTVYPWRNGAGHAQGGGSGITAPGGTTITGPHGNEVHVTGS